MSWCRLTLFCSRYVRSFTVSGPAGSPLRALQAASRAVSPLGLRPLTWAPPSSSRRTRRSLPEAAALMRGQQSDTGSHMACREHQGQSGYIFITFNNDMNIPIKTPYTAYSGQLLPNLKCCNLRVNDNDDNNDICFILLYTYKAYTSINSNLIIRNALY